MFGMVLDTTLKQSVKCLGNIANQRILQFDRSREFGATNLDKESSQRSFTMIVIHKNSSFSLIHETL